VPLVLRGDTVNGTGSDVTTTYSVSYCQGKDFFVCDQGQTWVPIANMQNLPGGSRDMSLGSWDVTTVAEGDYTLRLAVTSANSMSGMTQTFNDHYPVALQGAAPVPPAPAGGSGGGGCALVGARHEQAVDPLLPLLLMLAGLGLVVNARKRTVESCPCRLL
jgi:hypothetical protein